MDPETRDETEATGGSRTERQRGALEVRVCGLWCLEEGLLGFIPLVCKMGVD